MADLFVRQQDKNSVVSALDKILLLEWRQHEDTFASRLDASQLVSSLDQLPSPLSMTNRRDFLKTGAAAGALVLATPALTRAESLAQRLGAQAELPAMDPATKELLIEALNAAKMGGASFADARIGRYRNNFVITREKQIEIGRAHV